MLYIAKTCPICRTGNIGFHRCSDGATVILMCDECDSIWTSPDNVAAETMLDVSEPDYKVPGLDCTPWGSKGGWATLQDVDRVGWSSYVAGEGTPLDQL